MFCGPYIKLMFLLHLLHAFHSILIWRSLSTKSTFRIVCAKKNVFFSHKSIKLCKPINIMNWSKLVRHNRCDLRFATWGKQEYSYIQISVLNARIIRRVKEKCVCGHHRFAVNIFHIQIQIHMDFDYACLDSVILFFHSSSSYHLSHAGVTSSSW